jgi:SLT domain-containing protein
MTLGAQLDQQNKEFFTTQDIRQTQATGAETRLTLGTQGEQERANIGARGEQERLGYQTQGEQQRLGYQTQGEETRKTTVTQGEQERLGYQTQGKETRKTALQQNMQQNYVMGRQHDWAQDAYRTGGPRASQPSSAQPGLVE